MSRKWQSLLFDTCEAGVSSAVSPELLPPNQNAWGMNIDVRGGKPSTRPNLRNIGNLPPGLLQGCEYFGVQGGMLVASVAGRLYRIRIRTNSIDVDEISLTFRNSSIIRQVWMTQTVETLVIQDGQSNAIMYDGSTATRAILGEVPRGRQMAYGNGRLWVAVNANEVVAGDIRTGAPGSELMFTEATYLTGGGKLFFPKDITGMAFIPVTGQSDYGALLVYGAGESNAIRADITSRDDWGKIPGFVTGILRSVGAASQWSLVAVNQDLYWRDSNGGIRSIRNALADEAGPGSAPISREVSRLTDFDSQQLLPWCSGVYFDNRLLMTSSPSLMQNGGVKWENVISLDYAPISTMGGKSQPAYNGQWDGLNFVKLVGGEFAGKSRAFAITANEDGTNQLWEFGSGDRADVYSVCTDGTAEFVENPITCFIEYPQRDFGVPKIRKRLERCDVWLSEVNGEVELKVYWRPDNSVKWLLWDEAATCAKTSDDSTATPHVWKNLRSQYRPQFKTFTIPDDIEDVVKYSAQVGFEFQIRLEWTGRCKIDRVMVHGTVLDDPDHADRSGFSETCVESDVGDNQIAYELPTSGCPFFGITEDGYEITPGGAPWGLGGPVIPTAYTFEFCNTGDTTIYDVNVAVATGCFGGFVLTTPPASTIPAGQCATFVITYYPAVVFECETPSALITIFTGQSPILSFTVDDETHAERPEITVEPIPATVAPGGETFFEVTAQGTNPIVYQWQVSGDGGENFSDIEDDENYSGATTDLLVITNVPEGFNDNIYRVRVRNEWGQVYSDEVELTVGAFFLIPLSGLGDSRSFATESEACAFIDSCITYVFENTSITSIFGEQSSGPGPGGDYWQMLGYVKLLVSSGGSGKVAFAFTTSGGMVSFSDSNMGGGDGFLKQGTMTLYDENYSVVATDTASGTGLNVGFGGAFLDPINLSAGKYMLVIEYDFAAGGAGPEEYIAAIAANGSTDVTLIQIPPVIQATSGTSECGSACP